MAKGLKLALGLLALVSAPFLLLSLIGAVVLAMGAFLLKDFDDYLRYYLALGIIVLLFLTGRSLLLFREYIRKTQTESITENLQLKYGILIIKEVTFMIAYVLFMATFVNLLCVLMGNSRDWLLIVSFFVIPATLAAFINHKICDKIKCLQP